MSNTLKSLQLQSLEPKQQIASNLKPRRPLLPLAHNANSPRGSPGGAAARNAMPLKRGRATPAFRARHPRAAAQKALDGIMG